MAAAGGVVELRWDTRRAPFWGKGVRRGRELPRITWGVVLVQGEMRGSEFCRGCLVLGREIGEFVGKVMDCDGVWVQLSTTFSLFFFPPDFQTFQLLHSPKNQTIQHRTTSNSSNIGGSGISTSADSPGVLLHVPQPLRPFPANHSQPP